MDHLTDQIGTVLGCSDFNGTTDANSNTATNYTADFIKQYDVNNVFTSNDQLAITAQYHQAMKFSAKVLDAFNGEVVAALQAHGVPASAYAGLVNTINKVFYVGPYSLISATNKDCGAGWTLVNMTTGNKTSEVCEPNSASLASALVAGAVAMFAMLF